MRFIDFFSGIGGFRLGCEMAGHTCVGHCEIDKYANKSYIAMHRPKEWEWYADDIRSVKPGDLLSPVYAFTKRGGCWFCPNAREEELRHLRSHHRELWDKLLALEEEPNLIGDKWNTLAQVSIYDKERQFALEENQVRWEI